MGNTSTKLFTNTALDNTLLEDQQWLGITEKDLFDDAFVDILDASLKKSSGKLDRLEWYKSDAGMARDVTVGFTKLFTPSKRNSQEKDNDDLMIGIVVCVENNLKNLLKKLYSSLRITFLTVGIFFFF